MTPHFKSFLLEYLTDAQRKKLTASGVALSDRAKKDTDHLFGNSDAIHGEVKTSNDTGLHRKSSTHSEVEKHLGRALSVSDYRNGMIDTGQRKLKIGKLISDEKLRNDYASDPHRQGAKAGETTLKTSTHRGIEVAGQTNRAPDDLHPQGHPWRSCKQIDHRTQFRPLDGHSGDIKHGAVVHFVHDHRGAEIYRATLQPYHSEDGKHTVYDLDAEYGNTHPSFTASANKVKDTLNAGKPAGVYKTVGIGMDTPHYNKGNGGAHKMVHLGEKPELDQFSKHEDHNFVKAAISHPDATHDHITNAVNHPHAFARMAAAESPKLSQEHIDKLSDDPNSMVRGSILQHHPSDHIIEKTIKTDPDATNRLSAAKSKHLTPDHINHILEHDSDDAVKHEAIANSNATEKQISAALKHVSDYVAAGAASNHSATEKHLSVALRHKSKHVNIAALSNPNITEEQLEKAKSSKNFEVANEAGRVSYERNRG